eukprot:34028_1
MTALHFSLSDDGENSLFDFILQAHQLIKAGAIPIKEWQEIVKIIFQQMIQCTEYLHSKHTDPNFIRSVVGKDDYNHYIHPKRLAKTLQGSIWKATRNDNSNNQNYIGNTFSLKRKTNNDDVNSPNKGLSIKLDEDENTMDNERIINSNGVNIVNDKNGVDYLMGFGFEHGIKIKDNKTTDEKDGEKKNFYFKLPAEAKQYVTKQAESLEIPKTALVLMLGVLTTNGPIPIAHYRGWKTNNPNIVGILGTENISPNKNKSANNKVDIVPNSTDKNSHTLSFNKSLLHVGEISLTNNKSFNSQCSPANDSKRPLNQDVNKKQARKMAISNSNNTSSLIKALINKGSLNQNKNNNRNNTTQSATISTKTLYKTLGSSQLFQNNAARNLLTNNKLNTINSLTLLSPNASALFSPRHTGVNNNSIIGRNDTANANVGNGFRMTAPTANIAPVHVPYLGQNNNDISPINYNITPPAIITPLAITPTTKLPFYWSNIHFGVSFKCNNINNNNMNSQAAPYVQKQLQNSVNNHATSTVFKYPIRNDNIMNDSSRNLLLNSLNTLIQQQSITSYGTNDNNMNMNNNMNN